MRTQVRIGFPKECRFGASETMKSMGKHNSHPGFLQGNAGLGHETMKSMGKQVAPRCELASANIKEMQD